MVDTYSVTLPDFAGPLDLLLGLIEREELDITRIALAQVTDQYVAYLNTVPQADADELADFLDIAARLVLIKSQVLLPQPPPSVADTQDADVGDELVQQLVVYKQFKQVAEYLSQLEEVGLRSFVRQASPPKVEATLQPGSGTVKSLLRAARRAFDIKPPQPNVDTMVSPVTVTIGQQMVRIREALTTRKVIYLSQLLNESCAWEEVIVTFLAILELVKRHVVAAEQPDLFGDIAIRRYEHGAELSETEWEQLTGLTEVS